MKVSSLFGRIERSFRMISLLPVFLSAGMLWGQELEPRAYASTPVGLKAFAVGFSTSEGGVVMDPTLPVEDVTATINGISAGYFQSIGLFGRTASLSAFVPYAWGSMEGLLSGEYAKITRSGLGDARLRLVFNLYGAPAMKPREFAGYRQKTNLGLGFTFAAPTGQYDPAKLINLGSNRWAFKPELGVSHLQGKWLLEFGAGAWFFGTNDEFLGKSKRDQDAVLSLQGHVIYHLPRRMWVSFNGNYYRGGESIVDGVKSGTSQLNNSRVGVTFSFPIYRRHSVKVSYDDGALTRLGGDFSKFTVVYQFVWLGL